MHLRCMALVLILEIPPLVACTRRGVFFVLAYGECRQAILEVQKSAISLHFCTHCGNRPAISSVLCDVVAWTPGFMLETVFSLWHEYFAGVGSCQLEKTLINMNMHPHQREKRLFGMNFAAYSFMSRKEILDQNEYLKEVVHAAGPNCLTT